DDLGPRADLDPSTDRRSAEVAGAQADRDPGKDHDPAMDLDESVDHDLTVREVDAGPHENRVSDTHLGRHHRDTVREARKYREARSLSAHRFFSRHRIHTSLAGFEHRSGQYSADAVNSTSVDRCAEHPRHTRYGARYALHARTIYVTANRISGPTSERFTSTF